MNAQRKAVVVGYPFHAERLARVVNETARGWRFCTFSSSRSGTLRAFYGLRDAQALISVGGPGPSVHLCKAARTRRIPIVVIWVGSDVTSAAARLPEIPVRDFINFADAPWLAQELDSIGIPARYRALTAVPVGKSVAPLPTRFRVLTYLPVPRRRFYGETRIYALAHAMPAVEFLVIGNGEPDTAAPPNVKFFGHVRDVGELIDASTVLVRLPEHDGTSLMVLEALARARHVLWTHEFPGVRAVADDEAALQSLRALYYAHREGSLRANLDGPPFVRGNFSPATVAARFQAELDQLVAGT